MPLFGSGKDKKREEKSKTSVTYVVNNIGGGINCEYERKRVELMSTPAADKEGKSTNMSSSVACGKALEALGLPEGISYFAQARKLLIPEEARNKIEKDPELEKKFRKVLGISEKEEIPYKRWEC